MDRLGDINNESYGAYLKEQNCEHFEWFQDELHSHSTQLFVPLRTGLNAE